MKRLLLILIVVLSLSLSITAAASAARWFRTPTCSATTTTLTCSGEVVGIKRRLPAYGELAAQFMWKCADADLYTGTGTANAQIIPIENHEPFTISWTPPAVPPEQPSGCPSGTWLPWDPFKQQLGIVYGVVILFVFQQPATDFLTYQFGAVYPS
jgi:hypothetical protein